MKASEARRLVHYSLYRTEEEADDWFKKKKRRIFR